MMDYILAILGVVGAWALLILLSALVVYLFAVKIPDWRLSREGREADLVKLQEQFRDGNLPRKDLQAAKDTHARLEMRGR